MILQFSSYRAEMVSTWTVIYNSSIKAPRKKQQLNSRSCITLREFSNCSHGLFHSVFCIIFKDQPPLILDHSRIKFRGASAAKGIRHRQKPWREIGVPPPRKSN